MSPRRQYWDSSVFCAYFSEEAGRCDTVQDLLNEAHAGRLEIYTSSFALVEVLKLKGYKPITQKEEQGLIDFFEYPFIKIINADREICESARQHHWSDGLEAKDAVHLASALSIRPSVILDELFSWDKDFLAIDGVAKFNLKICAPYMLQPLLRLTDHDSQTKTESEDTIDPVPEPDEEKAETEADQP